MQRGAQRDPLRGVTSTHVRPHPKPQLKKSRAGSRPAAQKHPGMSRPAVTIDEHDLERAVLRKSVGDLSDGRHECADCGRSPLVGETLYRYAAGFAVCELCRPLRRDEPVESGLVRHSEYGDVVRVRRL